MVPSQAGGTRPPRIHSPHRGLPGSSPTRMTTPFPCGVHLLCWAVSLRGMGALACPRRTPRPSTRAVSAVCRAPCTVPVGAHLLLPQPYQFPPSASRKQRATALSYRPEGQASEARVGEGAGLRLPPPRAGAPCTCCPCAIMQPCLRGRLGSAQGVNAKQLAPGAPAEAEPAVPPPPALHPQHPRPPIGLSFHGDGKPPPPARLGATAPVMLHSSAASTHPSF